MKQEIMQTMKNRYYEQYGIKPPDYFLRNKLPPKESKYDRLKKSRSLEFINDLERLKKDKSFTLQAMGDKYGISKQRVHQLFDKAYGKSLRSYRNKNNNLKFHTSDYAEILYSIIKKYHETDYKELVSKKITLQKCNEMLQILYQCNEWENEINIKKYWEDCHQEKYFQFKQEYLTFVFRNKFNLVISYNDFVKEFPWMCIITLRKYLSFLSKIRLLHRKKGLYPNKIYVFKLNNEHPLIKEIFEGLDLIN